AIVAAAIASLLPAYRSVAVGLVAGWLALKIFSDWKTGPSAPSHPSFLRKGLSAGALLVALTVWGIALGYFTSARRLQDPRNVFGRLATWETAAGFAIENPLFGVGLTNYHYY